MFSKNAKCQLISTVSIKTVQRKQLWKDVAVLKMSTVSASPSLLHITVSVKVVRCHNALEYMFVA